MLMRFISATIAGAICIDIAKKNLVIFSANFYILSVVLLETAISSCLFRFYELTGSYGISLILLSFAVSLCLAPFYYLTGILEKKNGQSSKG
jgi:hypothetical protein